MTQPSNVDQLTFDDMRLTRALLNDPQRCASINEYSSATGIPISRMLELLGTALERGQLEMETAGGEAFVHTAPEGRLAGAQAGIPPNLWESLRNGRDIDTAFALWRLTRGLQHGGWAVEARQEEIPAIGGHSTFLALTFNRADKVPLLVLPDSEEIASPAGPLTRYERENTQVVAIATRNGELDHCVTGVRRWMLGALPPPRLHVLLLEDPRYQPVLLSGSDTSVTPRAVTRLLVEALARPSQP